MYIENVKISEMISNLFCFSYLLNVVLAFIPARRQSNRQTGGHVVRLTTDDAVCLSSWQNNNINNVKKYDLFFLSLLVFFGFFFCNGVFDLYRYDSK